MSLRDLHRKSTRTPEEKAKLRADRKRYQRERPTPEQLLAEGGHQNFVPLGGLLLLHQFVALARAKRLRQGLSLAELSELCGIDEAALSRLETGKNSNPTLDTLTRIAAALGNQIEGRFVPVAPRKVASQMAEQGKVVGKRRPAGSKKRKQAGKTVERAKGHSEEATE
jgi:transcriptional regulator with XRE-family HTH domain